MSKTEPIEITVPAGIGKLSRLFCGCCTDENTWGEVLKELERCDRNEYLACDGLAAAVCSWADCTEHGISIRAAWLTDAGRAALAFLRQYGIDWKSSEEYEFVHDGCRVGGGQ